MWVHGLGFGFSDAEHLVVEALRMAHEQRRRVHAVTVVTQSQCFAWVKRESSGLFFRDFVACVAL